MLKSGSTFLFLRHASLLLIVLTAALLTWHRFGMNRVLVLDPKRGFVYSAQDDRQQGGDSVAALELDDKSTILNCHLNTKYTWPFCQVAIRLAAMPNGVDLGNYDSITFDIAYNGPGPHSVRFYLRNFEADISNKADIGTLKVNETEIPLPESGEITVPIKLFRVASWWITGQKVPLMSTDMRIDNVSFVELSTGSLVQAGVHRIEIKSIRFNGKWISQAQLMMALVGAWFMFGISWLIIASQYFRAHTLMSKSRVIHLQSINQALKLETRELAGQARTDSLTGALNREGLREFLMTQWQGRLPADPPLTIIFADLDHFKQINDLHGHAIGDLVLQEFTKLVQNEIRSHDRLVRWGGEEIFDYAVRGHARWTRGAGLAESSDRHYRSRLAGDNLHISCSLERHHGTSPMQDLYTR